MAANLELFDCQTFVSVLELENITSKQIFVRMQLNEMPPIEITNFDTKDGASRVSLYKGVRYLARIECFSAFQTYPLYFYLCNKKGQVKGACGFDLSPMIVDSFRDTRNEVQTYKITLAIQNRLDEIIGNAHLEFAVRHFSADLNRIYCFEEVNNQLDNDSNQEKIEDAQIVDIETTRSHAQTSTKRRKLPRVYPRLADLLVLNKKYQSTRGNLLEELQELEVKVKKIEATKRRERMKRNQDLRRRLENSGYPEGSMSSSRSDDFSVFESNSDLSENSSDRKKKDTFNQVELLTSPQKYSSKKKTSKSRKHEDTKGGHTSRRRESLHSTDQSHSSHHHTHKNHKIEDSSMHSNTPSEKKERAKTKQPTSDFQAFIARNEAAASKRKEIQDKQNSQTNVQFDETARNKKKETQKKRNTQPVHQSPIKQAEKPKEEKPNVPPPIEEKKPEAHEVEKKPASPEVSGISSIKDFDSTNKSQTQSDFIAQSTSVSENSSKNSHKIEQIKSGSEEILEIEDPTQSQIQVDNQSSNSRNPSFLDDFKDDDELDKLSTIKAHEEESIIDTIEAESNIDVHSEHNPVEQESLYISSSIDEKSEQKSTNKLDASDEFDQITSPRKENKSNSSTLSGSNSGSKHEIENSDFIDTIDKNDKSKTNDEISLTFSEAHSFSSNIPTDILDDTDIGNTKSETKQTPATIVATNNNDKDSFDSGSMLKDSDPNSSAIADILSD